MDLSPTQLQFLERIKPVENAWKPRKEVKVVLITLPSPWLISDRDMPNLGILYVAAYLRENGINVQVVDFCGIPQQYWYVPEGDIYGISCTTPQYPLAKSLALKIRERQPDSYVVFGGYHPSALPDFTLEDAECDCVVVGDGEYAMLSIARGLRTPRIDGERVKHLDTLPWPARDMISIRDYQKIGTNAVVGKGAILEEYVLQSRGCPFSCLSADTPINTVEGLIPIKDLVGKQIGVFTYDPDRKEALVSTAVRIRRTGTNKKFVRVTFDDGTHIDCTPDHRFLSFKVRNQFVGDQEKETEAKDLTPGTRVRAIREEINGPEKSQYVSVCWSRKGQAKKHRMIVEWMLGRELQGEEEVHHKDGQKLNNIPSNLEMVSSRKDHMSKHPEVAQRMRDDNPTKNGMSKEWKAKIGAVVRERKVSDETKEKMRQAAIRRESLLSDEEKSARAKKGVASTSREKKIAYTKKGWGTRRRKQVNHRVVSVEELPGRHDVYCMEVPETGWFYANNVLVHNCGYCAQMLISGRTVRYRSPECIREEMTYLLERYKVNRFYIFDDIFVVDKKRVHAFCDMVDEMWNEGYRFDWHCLARADIGNLELYKRMVGSHCKQITYGLEHADDRILKYNLKECTAEQNMEAVQNAKKAGLRVRAQFIVGLPGETDESVKVLGNFIRSCPADSMACHIFVPLPGSPIYTHPERFGFEWNRGTDFLHYQTIGKPGEWKAHQIHLNAEDVLRWANELKAIIANKNVFHHDARHQAVIDEVLGAC